MIKKNDDDFMIFTYGNVMNNFDGSYSVTARVPIAGQYEITVQLDFRSCGGLREDGSMLSTSELGFAYAHDGRLQNDNMQRLKLFTELESLYPFHGERAIFKVAITDDMISSPPPPPPSSQKVQTTPSSSTSCASFSSLLAPGYYKLEYNQDLNTRSFIWIPREKCSGGNSSTNDGARVPTNGYKWIQIYFFPRIL
jgi:hypothetical protein